MRPASASVSSEGEPLALGLVLDAEAALRALHAHAHAQERGESERALALPAESLPASAHLLLPLPAAPLQNGAALVGELFGRRAVQALCHSSLGTIGAGSMPKGRQPQVEDDPGEEEMLSPTEVPEPAGWQLRRFAAP